MRAAQARSPVGTAANGIYYYASTVPAFSISLSPLFSSRFLSLVAASRDGRISRQADRTQAESGFVASDT